MVKVDKMEIKYLNLKNQKFDKEKLEQRKIEIQNKNQKDNQINKEEKNNVRVKLGKLNYEISKLSEKDNLTYEEKVKLEYMKQQRNDLKSKQKSTKSDWENQKQNEINMEKDMNLLEGFVKSEEKIDKILVYRNKLKEDLENQKLEKQKIDTEISKIGNMADLVIEYTNLKNGVEEAKKPDSKISNEDYLKMVAELESKEKNIKKLKELETRSKKIAKLIKSKQMAVTKCNLAWKCLFRNQTWDDIQLRAIKIKDNRENTNKENINEEKQEKIKENNQQETENIETDSKTNFIEKMKSWFFEEQEEEEEEKEEETKELVEYDEFAKKHPRLAKIRDFFKNRFFKRTKTENNKEGNNKENIKPEENKRDAFIEELRRVIENDDRQDIAQQYIEKHKKKEKNMESDKENSNEKER